MSSSSGSNTAGRSGRSPLASAPRPGNGSPAVNRVNAATGSSTCDPTSTKFPNLRPRNTAGSASTHTCGNTARTVAA